MTPSTYTLNRPVHLARRDVFLEQAADLFRASGKDRSFSSRLRRLDTTLYCLQAAVDHGALACQAESVHPHENSFLLFLRMVLYDLYAVRVIVETEGQLKDPDSPLRQLLHRPDKAKETVAFARTGEQVLQDIAHLFAMADEPFRDIRAAGLQALPPADQDRYRKASDGLRQHLAAHPPHPRRVTPGRIFSPTLEMKYG